MRFRVADLADEASLRSLLRAAFADYSRGLGREPGASESLSERIGKKEVHLAVTEEDGVVGVVVLRDDEGEPALHLDILAVDPRFQGRRVGAWLIGQAETKAKMAGQTALRLFTAAKYDHLVRLYQREGFVIEGYGPPPNREDDGFPRVFLRKVLIGEGSH